jgi:hypothetical protein
MGSIILIFMTYIGPDYEAEDLELITAPKKRQEYLGIENLQGHSGDVDEQDSTRPEASRSMGFKKLNPSTAIEVPGYSEFLNLPLTSEQFRLHPSSSVKMLHCFKSMR